MNLFGVRNQGCRVEQKRGNIIEMKAEEGIIAFELL